MSLTPEQRTADFQTMIGNLPKEFSLIPTTALINRLHRITNNEALYLTYFLNTDGDPEEIASALGTTKDNVKKILRKTVGKVVNISDETVALNLYYPKMNIDAKSKLKKILVDDGYLTQKEVANSQ